jgi:DNA-binding Lrp family transcriptional regulator
MAPAHSLTSIEKKVLYLISIDAGAPVSKIAGALGCKPHIVQLACKKFNKLGLLSRRVMIDTFRLGYKKHTFFIALSPEGIANKVELIRFLTLCGNVSTVTELSSDYDLLVEVISRSSDEFWDLQTRLASRFPTPIQKKEITVVTRQSAFGEKYHSHFPR